MSLTSVLGSVPGAALKADEPSDGRRQRSERAKQAALDALWELLHEGELMPSAQRVAERAGMSLRTLYHHYEGNEALFRELAWRQFARIQSLVLPLPPAQPVEDRVVALVGQRAALYESITPLRRAAILHEPTAPALHTSLDAFRAAKRAQVETLFGSELRSCQGRVLREVSAALGAAASWAAWESLRAHVHLSLEEARRVLAQTLVALLRQTPAAARLDAAQVLGRL